MIMKKVLLLITLLVFGFLFGCQYKTNKTELEELQAQSLLEEQNKEIIQRWLYEGDQENFNIIDELIAEDCKVHYDKDQYGRKFVRSMMEGFPKSFSEGVHIIEDLIAEKDKVVARMTIKAKHTGEIWEIEPSGKELEYNAITIYRLKAGKIIEIWLEHTAVLDLQRQLGMEMKMKETE